MSKPIPNFLSDFGPKLISQGYLLCAVHPGEKRPYGEKWQEHPLALETIGRFPKNCGIGIQCGKGLFPIYAVDIDVTDEEVSRRVMSRFRTEYPDADDALIRIGKAPKTLLVFRGEKPGMLKRRSRVYRRRPDEPTQQVEILGSGQQFVALGRYPRPKNAPTDYVEHDYTWVMNGQLQEGPDEVAASELPILTPEMIDRVMEIFETEAEAAGWNPVTNSRTMTAQRLDDSVLTTTALPIPGYTLEDAEQDVRTIRLNLGGGSYDTWVRLGMALHFQFSGSDEALELWDRLSLDLGPGSYQQGACAAKWGTFKDDRPDGNVCTCEWLRTEARRVRMGDLYDRLDEAGLVARFLYAEASRVRWIKQLSTFAYFNVPTGRWELTAGEMYIRSKIRDVWEKMLLEEAKLASDSLPEGADPKKDVSPRQRILNFRDTCLRSGANYQERVLKNLRSYPELFAQIEQFDDNPRYFGVGNGVLDIKSRVLVENRPELYVLRRSEVMFDPQAKCPLWDKALLECFSGDAEKVKVFYRFFGPVLTGAPKDEVLALFRGLGCNGKSMVLNVVRRLLGGYAEGVGEETLLGKAGLASGGGPRSDLAKLQGARFVYCSETTENNRLREADIKRMTGRDGFTCRAPYGQADMLVKPHFRIVIVSNHAPVIRGDDDGIWRRMCDFEFPVNFDTDPRYHKDPDLEEKLETELSGILNRFIEGYDDYLSRGSDISMSRSMKESVLEYRAEMDDVRQWFELECVYDDSLPADFELKDEDMYRHFMDYMKRSGEKTDYNIKQFRRRVLKYMPQELRKRSSHNSYRLRKFRFRDAADDMSDDFI